MIWQVTALIDDLQGGLSLQHYPVRVQRCHLSQWGRVLLQQRAPPTATAWWTRFWSGVGLLIHPPRLSEHKLCRESCKLVLYC